MNITRAQLVRVILGNIVVLAGLYIIAGGLCAIGPDRW
jgi:hypothetical protein